MALKSRGRHILCCYYSGIIILPTLPLNEHIHEVDVLCYLVHGNKLMLWRNLGSRKETQYDVLIHLVACHDQIRRDSPMLHPLLVAFVNIFQLQVLALI
jgi:hypothetical protein